MEQQKVQHLVDDVTIQKKINDMDNEMLIQLAAKAKKIEESVGNLRCASSMDETNRQRANTLEKEAHVLRAALEQQHLHRVLNWQDQELQQLIIVVKQAEPQKTTLQEVQKEKPAVRTWIAVRSQGRLELYLDGTVVWSSDVAEDALHVAREKMRRNFQSAIGLNDLFIEIPAAALQHGSQLRIQDPAQEN